MLAYSSPLPDRAVGGAVPRRRPAFLEQSASRFHQDGRALAAAEIADEHRSGMLRIARATSRAERAWLCGTLGEPTRVAA